MAQPVILTDVSKFALDLGREFQLQLSATNEPDGWEISKGALPSSDPVATLSAAGLITITPNKSGVFKFSVIATLTGDTDSDPIDLVFAVSAAGVVLCDDIATPLDFNLVTRRVTIPGITPEDQAPDPTKAVLGPIKEDDIFPINLGLKNVFGELIEADPDRIRVYLKEFEPDKGERIDQVSFQKLGSCETTRYRIYLDFDEAQLGKFLRNYETDFGTIFAALCEIEIAKLAAAVTFTDSQTKAIAVYDEGDVHSHTTDVTLAATDAIQQYSIALHLDVTGDPLLDVQLELLVVVTWDGATYSVTAIEGDLSGVGASAAPDDWDSKLEVLSLVGTATGLRLKTKVTSTEQGIRQLPASPDKLELQHFTVETGSGGSSSSSGGTPIDDYLDDPGGLQESWLVKDSGGNTIFVWEPSQNDTGETIKAEFEAELGETLQSVLLDESSDAVEFEFAHDTAVFSMRDNSGGGGSSSSSGSGSSGSGSSGSGSSASSSSEGALEYFIGAKTPTGPVLAADLDVDTDGIDTAETAETDRISSETFFVRVDRDLADN